MLAFLACSVATLVPITIGGSVRPWRSGPVLGCFAAAAAALAFLVYHQRHLARRPAFPRQVFGRPAASAALLGSLVSGALLSMVFYNLVLFWEGVRHLAAARVGRMLLSVTLTYAASAALTGVAIRLSGRVRWATFLGAALSTLGLGLMQLMGEGTPPAALVAICACGGAGCGAFLPAMVNTLIASTDREWHSHAVATRTLLYTAGQSVGVSAGLAIFTSNFRYQNRRAHQAHEGGIKTPQDLMQMIKEMPPEVVGLINNALRWVWGVACVLAFVAGVVTCIPSCPELPKDRKIGAAAADEESQGGDKEKVNAVKQRV